jgi:hypothetical protein
LDFQVEVGGQTLGKGVGLTWEEAKLQVIQLTAEQFFFSDYISLEYITLLTFTLIFFSQNKLYFSA